MMRRAIWICVCAAFLAVVSSGQEAQAQQQRAFGQIWGYAYGPRDWERFYHYPYVYYPQNYWGNEYYQSSESLYYRYPPEMRVPVYNRQWQNYYPAPRRYHSGHHFMLDVF